MTLFEFQAGQVRKGASLLAYWVATTHPDRLKWAPKPEGEFAGRTVLNQIGECVRIYRSFAAVLRGGTMDLVQQDWVPSNAEEAQTELLKSAEEFACVLLTLDETVLEKEFSLPWAKVRGMFLITMPVHNASYHGGQINYIQTLYGDTRFHYPGEA